MARYTPGSTGNKFEMVPFDASKTSLNGTAVAYYTIAGQTPVAITTPNATYVTNGKIWRGDLPNAAVASGVTGGHITLSDDDGEIGTVPYTVDVSNAADVNVGSIPADVSADLAAFVKSSLFHADDQSNRLRVDADGEVIADLGTNAPADWINADAIANGALTAAKIALNAIGSDQVSDQAIAEIQAGLFEDADVTAMVNAIVAAIDAADIENDVLPALIGGWILNRSLAGNHDTAGSTGALIQKLNVTGTLANTDNADDFKADTASLATDSDVDSAKDDIIQQGDAAWTTATGFATEAKQDAAKTVIDGIKTTTDKLDDTLVDNAGTYEFTTAALANVSVDVGDLEVTVDEDSIANKTLAAIKADGTPVTLTSPLSPNTLALTLVRGDDYTAGSPNGPIDYATPVSGEMGNLTGASVAFSAVKSKADTPAIDGLAGSIVSPNTESQVVRVQILDTDWSGVTAGHYTYDVQVTKADGTVTTVARSTLQVLGDVTT
jgi:hypothetical protein